jgi:hypothetical protein
MFDFLHAPDYRLIGDNDFWLKGMHRDVLNSFPNAHDRRWAV